MTVSATARRPPPRRPTCPAAAMSARRAAGAARATDPRRPSRPLHIENGPEASASGPLLSRRVHAAFTPHEASRHGGEVRHTGRPPPGGVASDLLRADAGRLGPASGRAIGAARCRPAGTRPGGSFAVASHAAGSATTALAAALPGRARRTGHALNDRETISLRVRAVLRTSERPGHAKSPAVRRGFRSGGAMGIRTPDLLHAMEARYQLRYSPLRSTTITEVRSPRVTSRVRGTS